MIIENTMLDRLHAAASNGAPHDLSISASLAVNRRRCQSLARLGAVMAMAALTCSVAAAQEPAEAAASGAETTNVNRLTGTVVLGAVAIPRYEGSKAYQAFPLVSGQVSLGHRYVELQGTSLRVNIINSPTLAVGPAASFTFGRGSDAPASVRALGTIGDAFEVGGFAALSFPGVLGKDDMVQLSVQVTADVSGQHDGTVGQVSASYRLPVTSRLWFAFDAHVGFADGRYARRYFSITPAGAAASGLARFDAGGGARDAGSGLSIGYAIDRRWSLIMFGNHRRLVGDVAASPVVSQAGNRNQFVAGAGIGWRF